MVGYSGYFFSFFVVVVDFCGDFFLCCFYVVALVFVIAVFCDRCFLWLVFVVGFCGLFYGGWFYGGCFFGPFLWLAVFCGCFVLWDYFFVVDHLSASRDDAILGVWSYRVVLPGSPAVSIGARSADGVRR